MARTARPAVIEFAPVFDPPGEHYSLALSLTILGEPGRKSNQRRIVTNQATGKMMLIKSEKAMSYTASFLSQVPSDYQVHLGSREVPLALWAKVYYASNRPDLSSELLMDLLQEAGVINNDRFVKAQFLFGAIDRENPRVEIRIYWVRDCRST